MKWWTYWALRKVSRAPLPRWVSWVLEHLVLTLLVLLALAVAVAVALALAVAVPWVLERLGSGYVEAAGLAAIATAFAMLLVVLCEQGRNLLIAWAVLLLLLLLAAIL